MCDVGNILCLICFYKMCVAQSHRWPKICLREQRGRVVNWLDRMNLRLRIIRIVKEEVGSMSALCYPESAEIYTPENVIKTLTTGDYPYLVFIDDELTRLKFNPPEEL